MHGPIVQVENVARDNKTENPMMGFDVPHHRLDRMTHESKNGPHYVHLTSLALNLAVGIYHGWHALV
jgi:hypothetical protein